VKNYVAVHETSRSRGYLKRDGGIMGVRTRNHTESRDI
jgi:hypothetical protein